MYDRQGLQTSTIPPSPPSGKYPPLVERSSSPLSLIFPPFSTSTARSPSSYSSPKKMLGKSSSDEAKFEIYKSYNTSNSEQDEEEYDVDDLFKDRDVQVLVSSRGRTKLFVVSPDQDDKYSIISDNTNDQNEISSSGVDSERRRSGRLRKPTTNSE